MKVAKFFAVIFGVIGAVIMVGSIGLCLLSLDAPVQVAEMPEAAVECSEELMEALEQGDFAAAGNVLYGQPDLGVERLPDEDSAMMVWTAFTGSISYEFKGDCYATDSGFARDAAITALDIPSVTASLSQRAHALLTARVESATDMAELYDENNDFREDLVEEVLSEALVQALAEDAETVTRDVTLNMICRDGQWWVVPDQALLQAISGGVA